MPGLLSPGFQKPHPLLYLSVPSCTKYVNINQHPAIICVRFFFITWSLKPPNHYFTFLFTFGESRCRLENFKRTHLQAIKENSETEKKNHLFSFHVGVSTESHDWFYSEET